MAITTLTSNETGANSLIDINANFADLDTTKADLASPTFTGTPTLPTGTIGVTQSASDNSTKLATTAYVDNQIATSSVTLTTTVDISSADILALHTTPKELIATPGAGKIIVIDSFVWKLLYGSVAYVNGDHVKVIYQSDTTNLLAGVITDSVYIKATADVVGIFDIATTINGTVGINKAIQLTLNSATAFITGNSTAKAFIKYRIITL